MWVLSPRGVPCCSLQLVRQHPQADVRPVRCGALPAALFRQLIKVSDWEAALSGWWFSSSLRWLVGEWWFSSPLTWSVLGSTFWFYALFTHAYHKWFNHIPILKSGGTQTICQGCAVPSSCVPRSHFDISRNLMLHGQGIEAHPPFVLLCAARLLNAVQVWCDCFMFLTFWSFFVNKN